ncbi:MAG: LacI family DNA-binding transcriptional regulator [Bacilli bacterium]
MATIKDIAKNLGLSTSTISRALNGNKSISEKTRNEVKAEAQRIHFTVNSMARSLISNKSYTIALFVDADNEQAFQNPYFYEETHGIENYVYKNGYSLLVANVKTAQKGQDMIDFITKSKRADGLILPSNILTDELAKKLNAEKIPFVSIGQPGSLSVPVSWIDIDNYRGAEAATACLIKEGKRHLAFLGLNKQNLFSNRRYEGFRNALYANNLELSEECVVECGKTKEDGYREMNRLLAKHPSIDGILCGDELLSIGAIKAIAEAEKHIPQDIALISFDSAQIAELSYPSITTIDVDVFQLGYQCARLLFELMNNPDSKDQGILVSTGIQYRETTNEANERERK